MALLNIKCDKIKDKYGFPAEYFNMHYLYSAIKQYFFLSDNRKSAKNIVHIGHLKF